MTPPARAVVPDPSRLHAADLLRVGSTGLRTRRTRAILSALGIAIGIAAMVGVLGISESSKADLIAQLDRLGTNLLRVTPGQSLGGESATLPTTAAGMIGRIPAVETVSAVATLDNITVRRTKLIDPQETGGITAMAADDAFLRTLGGTTRAGRFLNSGTLRYPVVVLGAVAAQRLGISTADGRVEVWLGGRRFTVGGILAPLPLAPEVDRAALVGFPVARNLFNLASSPTTIYLRSNPDDVDDVRSVVAATANPENPEEVRVSRPSDALAARAAAKSAFTTLFLGLGAVALLVGGVGIANVMVISVLERRAEIGLRRALGATRHHIRTQFLAESQMLSGFGGVGGVLLGALVTVAYAMSQDWAIVIPPVGLVGGLLAALLIGAIAGIYPAMRAARLAPVDALRTS